MNKQSFDGFGYPKNEGQPDWNDISERIKAHLDPKYWPWLDECISGVAYGGKKEMRQFESGATRDTDEGKIDYQGFLSVEVLERYGRYMLRHQKQADGQMRASDNWKKGIPRDAYIKSMFRHFIEVVQFHEREKGMMLGSRLQDDTEAMHEFDEAICALLFNVMGYMYEQEKGR